MENKICMYCLFLTRVFVLDSAPWVHSRVSNVNFVLYLLYAQMSIQCFEYAFTVIYLSLVARNL